MTLNTSKFLDLLQLEYSVALELTDYLQQEQQALTDNHIELLETLQTHKQATLSALQQQALQRIDWMEQHQLPLSSECLHSFSSKDAATISPLWKNLANSYQQNQQLSARLSEMVLILRHRTQQKINILHGKKNDSGLYNQSGQASTIGLGKQSIQA